MYEGSGQRKIPFNCPAKYTQLTAGCSLHCLKTLLDLPNAYFNAIKASYNLTKGSGNAVEAAAKAKGAGRMYLPTD
jgi:hypothetical protein